MAERILIVDDDQQLTSFLERFLKKQGYSVKSAASAKQMGLMMEHQDFDLVVLDIGLPDIDGFELISTLRHASQLPVIVLTARDEVFDRIVGLELGADDYLTKPFEPRELLARVKSVLRRVRPSAALAGSAAAVQKYQFSEYTLDLVARRLTNGENITVPLTSTEFSLIKALAEHAGEVLSRERMLEALYGNSATVTDRTIDAHIARLRHKLDAADLDDSIIRTVHGVGYTLAVAVHSA